MNTASSSPLAIRTITVTRYLTPLREGGSLPGIVEGDDLGTYVLKFRGAGQGPRVLIAELLAGEIARVLGLPIPEIVFAEVDPALGRAEPDQEVQELLQRSEGLNLAFDYLPGSFAFDPVVAPAVDPGLASSIVWFDALITNVDRTIRNTNLLFWHGNLFLIDNGAAFYAQYAGPDFPKRARAPFPQIREHVLIDRAGDLAAVDVRAAEMLDRTTVSAIVDLIPDTWLQDPGFAGPSAQRDAFRQYLTDRLVPPRPFLKEAIDAHAHRV